MDLTISKRITIQENVTEDELCKVMDKLSDLESEVCIQHGYRVACGLIEHEWHYPKGHLDADADEAEMHFDEIADAGYDIAQKIILTALVRMNWLEAHKDFIRKQQREWEDRNDA